MRLTWRDAVTTVLAAMVAVIYLTFAVGWAIPVVDDARGATLLIGLIGLSMCIVGGSGSTIAKGNIWIAPLGVLGGVSLMLVVGGLITGWDVAVPTLAAVIGLMWTISTVHHAVESRTRRYA